MYIGHQKTPMTALEKRVPRNPKYSKIQATIDTGASVSNVKILSTKEFLRRQNELFDRIKASDLMQLLNSIDREESNLLLLDSREVSDFQNCRIQTAVSYPLVNLHQDRITGDMYKFKNSDSKLIVVYDDDERVASVAARALVERGFNNIRMLSGGLISFGNHFPNHLVGTLPEELVRVKPLSPTESVARRRELRRERQVRGESPRSYAGSVSGFSTSSTLSHQSTFSRTARWKENKAAVYHHKELVSKLHHTAT